jgi:hypothetical protein
MLLDESGLLMAPLLRRSWAPRGCPPVSRHRANHREKVSVAAGLWLTPSRDRVGLVYQTLVNGYFSNESIAEFLGAVAARLPGPVVLIWDGCTMHQGDPIEELVDDSAGRLDLERLPANAPELMPVEFLWRCLKYGRLCNFTPTDTSDLHEAVLRELRVIAQDQLLLRSFFYFSALPFPRTLLT